MPTTISVKGSAEHRAAPELAAAMLSVGASGSDRADVAARTSAAHARLLDEIRQLEASGALETWSADQVRAWSHRPWNADGELLPLVHQASADVEVVFRDLARAGEWLGDAAAIEELTIGGVAWRLTDETHALARESAQRAAVAEAVAKAGVYSSALGLGAPVVVELADHEPQSAAPTARLMAIGAGRDGGGATELAPRDLVIAVSVDARFIADTA